MKAQPTTPFTVPVLCDGNNSEWYIYFKFFHLGAWHERKLREGMNRIKSIKDRRAFAESLIDARHTWLKSGWNPVIDPEFKLRNVKGKDNRQTMLFNDAMDFAFSKKKLKKKSFLSYRSQLAFIRQTAEKTGHALLPVDQMDRGECLDLLDECAKIRKFTNHSINKHAATIRAMYVELLKYRVVDVNPLRDLAKLPVPESNKFEAFTPQEKEAIARHLGKTHPQLFVVMSVIYHTGIRPKETLALRINDIDLKNDRITIAPEEDGENAKTLSVRRVPINPHLKGLLLQMKLHTFPADFYVFGSHLPHGGGGGGSVKVNGKVFHGAKRPDYFTPSAVMVKRDTLTKLWKEIIIDGLGINKHLYAAKHTGTDDKVEAGLDLKDVQFLYGHATEAMTARYNKKKRELEAKEGILEKSPAFAIVPQLKAV